jgi:DNA polymerase I
MENKQPEYILVDGSSYLYRAYHALPPLITSTGHPTGAVRGVVNMLRKICNDYPSSKVVTIFDAKGKTFRHDMYEEYKANRPSMPDELRVQIQPLYEVIKAMGLPLIIEEGVEADDVIGTLAYEAAHNNKTVLISTGDKDMAQLVNEHVHLINTMTDEYLDEEGVRGKFGVGADRIIDYLALMGDKVDNIPGVEKCGPKTAVKWLSLYDSLDGVMNNADKIKGKVGENLRDALERLPLSYDLATIRDKLQLAISFDELEKKEEDSKKLFDLFNELEFKSLLKVMDSPVEETPKNSISGDYQSILTEDDFSVFLSKLKSCKEFAFDTETNSLDVHCAELVGVSFSLAPGSAVYIPFMHSYEGAPEQLDRSQTLSQLKPILESEQYDIVGQNLKFDANILRKYGIMLSHRVFDTMLESYVLNPTETRHNMDALSVHYLNHKPVSFVDVVGKGQKQITFDQVHLEEAVHYAAEDADITLRLHHCLYEKLKSTHRLGIFEKIERPMLYVLGEIEWQGVMLDKELLIQQSIELKDKLEVIERDAHDIAGKVFNLSSPKQVGQILFSEEELNLPVIKKTAKGAPSTSEEVLQELSSDFELPKLLLKYRGLAKLKNTYTDKLPNMINVTTQRVHTSYHQAVVATGRLSSSVPNLQNIPIKTLEGRRIRQAFIAPCGSSILAADYSQVELRIMAHLSEDEGLIKAFKEKQDVHSATASEIFSVEISEVSSDMRRKAKAINFGLMYGMSAFGLAKQLHVSRYDAEEYIDLYFSRYPGVKTYVESIRKQAMEDGYVETVFGRRLYLPEIKSKNKMRQQAALRAAINAPMQGTAADIIKKAMIDIDQYVRNSEYSIKMIMQVHDELVFEVADAFIDEAKESILNYMTQAGQLLVPLTVDVGVGKNWDEAH